MKLSYLMNLFSIQQLDVKLNDFSEVLCILLSSDFTAPSFMAFKRQHFADMHFRKLSFRLCRLPDTAAFLGPGSEKTITK